VTKYAAVLFAAASLARAQEAASGFDLRVNLSTAGIYSHQLSQAPRSDGPLTGGARALLYPTWKLSSHWTVFGAVQVHSRPYFAEEVTTQGYGVKADVLQANISYSRSWANSSLQVRIGELTSAFGSFLLRYDPADNPLAGMPSAYGYYYKPVTSLGLMGAQVDGTAGRVDLRAQFVNSSPGNRRSIFDNAQYGSWAGGAGITIMQGFRAGVSAYRGPYLHRKYRFYFPGEADPRDLPGSGYGIDVQWGRGHWNVWGELQRHQRVYRAMPTYNQHTGYAEIRRVLNPRWYVAARAEYYRASVGPGGQIYEMAAGFRPNRHQLLKFDYAISQGPAVPGSLGNAAILELVTTLHPVSVDRD
jgi:hypothetical protein